MIYFSMNFETCEQAAISREIKTENLAISINVLLLIRLVKYTLYFFSGPPYFFNVMIDFILLFMYRSRHILTVL